MKKKKKEKKRNDETKDDGKGIGEAYRCLVASFISVSSLFLNSFSSFWRKQKSAIHDVLSTMTQLQTNIDYMPDE